MFGSLLGDAAPLLRRRTDPIPGCCERSAASSNAPPL